MSNYVGKVFILPQCDNSIVIPLRATGGGYVCRNIISTGDEVDSYLHEIGLSDAIDITDKVLQIREEVLNG